MATAVIDIRVKGGSELSRVRKQVAKINDLVRAIKPIPSLFDTRTFQGLDALYKKNRRVIAASNRLKDELKGIADGTIKVQGTTASLNRQLGNLQSIFGSLSAGTKEWRQALVATERAQVAVFKSDQKIMNQRAKSLSSRGGGKDIVPSVLGASGSVAQSVNGLAAYRSELQRLRNEVKIGSKEYNDLGAAIERVNRTLSAKEGLAGLRQNLDQVSASQSRLLAINSGYVSQTLQVRKAEQALNAELLNRKKVLDAIMIAEQRAMGGSGGIIQRAGRGGLDGLRTALADAEGIQSRMLTTEEGYTRQVEIVRDLQKAVNSEIAQRDLLMGKVNIKEEKSISLAQRLRGLAGNVGSAAVRGARPGRAIERRGLMAGGLAGIGGLGMFANTGVGQTLGGLGTGASNLIQGGLNIAGSGPLAIPGAAKAAKDIGLVSAGLGKVVATGKGVAALSAFNPAWVGAALLAWVTFGNKGLAKAIKGFLGVEKTARKVIPPVVEASKTIKLVTSGMSHSFKLNSSAAQQLKVDTESVTAALKKQAIEVDRLAKVEAQRNKLAKARVQRGISTGTVLGGGFASWSSSMDKQYPTGDARVQMEAANKARRAEMQMTNMMKNENLRLVEIKGEQLDIDQRIARVLKRRGQQIGKNGRLIKENNKARGGGGMMSGFSGSRAGQAVLGGGFPLLFGGGPGAVAGGAIGGLLGGFAGGIGASVVGGMIDKAVAGVGQLGMAMNPLTADIAKLTTALGLAGTAEGKRIAIIEQLAGKEAALEAVRRRMVERIGNANTQALEDFGKTWQAIVNNFQLQLLKIAALVAKFAQQTGLAKWLTTFGGGAEQVITGSQRNQLFNSDSDLGKKYQIAKSDYGSAIDRRFSAQTAFDEAFVKSGRNPLFRFTEEGKLLNEELRLANKEFSLTQSIVRGIEQDYVKLIELGGIDTLQKTETQKIITGSLKSLEEQKQVLEDTLKGGTVYAEVQKRIRDLRKQTKDTDFEISKQQIKQIEDAVKGEESLRRQLELWTQIKDTVATGLTSAIQGLIDGTKSLGESLASIAKSIGSMLIQSAISGWLAPVGVPGKMPAPTVTVAQGGYMANGIKPFAYGGIATRPTLGLVGEAGEDEYIIPASKMAASMQRYSAGARGEAVIPGTGSSYAGGGVGGSTTVNYSGPILNFNSEEFVPKSAVGQIIATATSQGARAGENRTLSTLRNSRSARSRLGM